jgi:hypothetical protein
VKVKVDVNRLVVVYVTNIIYNIIQKSTCQSISALKWFTVPISAQLKNNYYIFVWLSVKVGIFAFKYGEIYDLHIIDQTGPIDSRYSPKSDQLKFW